MQRGTLQSAKKSRVVGLDLLRGFAIALVLLRHAWPDTFGSAGIVGVVMFFALSGYLITGILMKDIHRTGRVNLVHFYRNRVLRLVPALLVFLVGMSIVTLIWDPTGQRDTLWFALLIGLTYTGNVPIPQGNAAIGHLWTLATEEQFYLLWPLILTGATRGKRMVRAFVLTAVLIVAVMIVTMFIFHADLERVYGLPTSWALAMVIGAAARIWGTRVASVLPARATERGVLASIALVAVTALAFLPDSKGSVLSYLVLGPVIALLTVVIIHIWSDWKDLPTRALAPLLFLGTISYAAYLWNYPIAVWLGALPSAWWTPWASIILTIAAATASWFAVERRVLRRKDRSKKSNPSTERSGELGARVGA